MRHKLRFTRNVLFFFLLFLVLLSLLRPAEFGGIVLQADAMLDRMMQAVLPGGSAPALDAAQGLMRRLQGGIMNILSSSAERAVLVSYVLLLIVLLTLVTSVLSILAGIRAGAREYKASKAQQAAGAPGGQAVVPERPAVAAEGEAVAAVARQVAGAAAEVLDKTFAFSVFTTLDGATRQINEWLEQQPIAIEQVSLKSNLRQPLIYMQAALSLFRLSYRVEAGRTWRYQLSTLSKMNMYGNPDKVLIQRFEQWKQEHPDRKVVFDTIQGFHRSDSGRCATVFFLHRPA